MNTELAYKVDERTVKEFDSRYRKGYMTAPRVIEKRRVSEVVSSLALPPTGTVLDFGCGKGEFSIVVAKLLPGWRVVGVDISRVAVDKAKELYPELSFYTMDELKQGEKFDLIFSHHVLEYVKDLNYVFSRFAELSKPTTLMLHVVPCGNRSGIEYQMASQVRGGIDEHTGLYFFEHSAHVRRYAANGLDEIAESKNFRRIKCWFVDHYWGALEWITRSDSSFLRAITPFKLSTSPNVLLKLTSRRCLLYFLYLLRYPKFNIERVRRKRNWGLLRRMHYYAVRFLFYPSAMFNMLFLLLVELEWRRKKHSLGGGKMYLVFTRSGNEGISH